MRNQRLTRVYLLVRDVAGDDAQAVHVRDECRRKIADW
jgi:hypothetical protein